MTPASGPLAGLTRRLPLTHTLRSHDRAALAGDVAAGATVGVLLIPQGMAYATIAGLPPVYGLYAALVPLVVYALLGTSRQLAVGPVAIVALLVATTVAPLAAGDADRYLALALLLSAMTGVIQLGAGIVRAGFLVNLLSHPVLTGFTSASAVIIAMSQLGGLTGLDMADGPVHRMLADAGAHRAQAHTPTLVVGVGAIVVGVGLKRWLPRAPSAMLLVAVGTLASWLLGLGERGVAIVGVVPSGLPTPSFPTWGGDGSGAALRPEDITALLPAALAISLIGYMSSIAVAKVYASRNRYDVDPDQELRALGLANIAGAFFQAFPTTGGLSRTAVNAGAGARSQLSSLVSVGIVALALLFLMPLFYHLPTPVLAAVIVVAVAGLIDVHGARMLWRVDRRDFALLCATFVATLLFGIERGILLGAALSVAALLQQISTPRIAVLGRVPGTDRYRDVDNVGDAIVEPGVAVLRMDASLFFGNAEAFRDAARSAFPGGRAVLVVDAYPMNRVDSTALAMLSELVHEIHAQGGRVHFSGVKAALLAKLTAAGVADLIGLERFYPELRPAVDAAAGWIGRATAEAASERDISPRVALP